jgi:mannose-6-phosphate isomerase-like protein (cupin superfamily)
MTSQMISQARPTGGKPAYWSLGALFIVHVDGEETGGEFALVEAIEPPGLMTPLHVHHRESQTMFVFEGEVTVYLPGKTLVVGPGESVYKPKGVPHTYKLTSETPARLLEVEAPAGFERFVAAAGDVARELTVPPRVENADFTRAIALAPDYGIEILGPPGALPE